MRYRRIKHYFIIIINCTFEHYYYSWFLRTFANHACVYYHMGFSCIFFVFFLNFFVCLFLWDQMLYTKKKNIMGSYQPGDSKITATYLIYNNQRPMCWIRSPWWLISPLRQTLITRVNRGLKYHSFIQREYNFSPSTMNHQMQGNTPIAYRDATVFFRKALKCHPYL